MDRVPADDAPSVGINPPPQHHTNQVRWCRPAISALGRCVSINQQINDIFKSKKGASLDTQTYHTREASNHTRRVTESPKAYGLLAPTPALTLAWNVASDRRPLPPACTSCQVQSSKIKTNKPPNTLFFFLNGGAGL